MRTHPQPGDAGAGLLFSCPKLQGSWGFSGTQTEKT
jgi:hypothetical protein